MGPTNLLKPLCWVGVGLAGLSLIAREHEGSQANSILRRSAGDSVVETAGARTSVRAFPTAEGFGANAVGGRGGRVIEVTTLDDAGPGSLRSAMEASGPRIVVFRVSGTITLQSAIRVRTPYLTVIGQTSPGGVQIKGNVENYLNELAGDPVPGVAKTHQ